MYSSAFRGIIAYYFRCDTLDILEINEYPFEVLKFTYDFKVSNKKKKNQYSCFGKKTKTIGLCIFFDKHGQLQEK